MNLLLRIPLLTLLFSSAVVYADSGQLKWQSMLDANLSDWETYLSYRYKVGFNGEIPKDKQGKKIAPIGVLKDPQDHGVFTVVGDKAAPKSKLVLKVSGEIYGGLTTKQEYRNYRLKLKFKWGEKIFDPRKKLLKDSGILYHATGEHGQEYWRSWMVSQEFQVMRGHLGDYWNQKSTAMDVRAFSPEYIMNPVADESQAFLSVGEGEDIKGFVLRKENHEKKEGEWNDLELICFEGKSLHIVNGEVVMVLKNSRKVKGDGSSEALLQGKIQIQSEAAELYYKDIYMLEITTLPEKYLPLYSS